MLQLFSVISSRFESDDKKQQVSFVLLIPCFGSQSGINYPSEFLKTLKFQNFQKSRVRFISKIDRTKHVVTG